MKPITLLLSASLVANLGLVTLIATRTRTEPPIANANAGINPAPGNDTVAALRAALASGDRAALEAAGISPEIARELALGRKFSQLAERIRATNASSSSNAQWWKNRASAGSREQLLALRRELSDALIAAFGDDLGLGGGDRAQLAFLTPAKREALRRITQDYDEMMAKFSAGGVQLASDREKLRLLRAERERDIAALLTPDERLAYEMRTSPTSAAVRARYGDAIESEAEFQKIYALQKAFDEQFPREALTGRITPETLRARADAERQLDSELRAAVGEERYAALRRAADPDWRTVDSLVSRLDLPSATPDTVMSSRDAFAAESQRISNDASLSMAERRAQIQALAARAKADLTRALGAEAADAYAQRSPWMNMLQGGVAYSTTPQEDGPGSLLPGGQSVHPVMPAGVVPAGAQRQVMFQAAPLVGGVVGDPVAAGGDVQVMTFPAGSVSVSVDESIRRPGNVEQQQKTAPVAAPKQ
jgi:hypothetical protein